MTETNTSGKSVQINEGQLLTSLNKLFGYSVNTNDYVLIANKKVEKQFRNEYPELDSLVIIVKPYLKKIRLMDTRIIRKSYKSLILTELKDEFGTETNLLKKFAAFPSWKPIILVPA